MIQRRIWQGYWIGTVAAVVLALVGCKHDHDEASGHNDHAAHGHGNAENEELDALSVTIWAAKTELFMEYEPLVVDKESRFAAHLTTLSDFKAVTQGVLSLTLEFPDGKKQQARADGPASPGIFRFKLGPNQPGACKLTLAYEGQGLTDRIDAGSCAAHPDITAARKAQPEGEDGGIAYTKEQQWQVDFATIPVERRKLQPSVRAAGEIQAVSGTEARVAAPARGRVSLPSPAPTLGMAVNKGQLLGTLLPYLTSGSDPASLRAELQAAEAELSAAETALARLERLLAEGAVPERRVDEARARVQVAKATRDGAKGRLAQYNQGAAGVATGGAGAFQLRSAVAGTLVEATVATGDSVEEGAPLFVVIDMTRVWLVARVFEPDIPKMELAASAWFTLEGYDKPFTIDEKTGRLVTVGSVIDPQTRTVPVVFELENPDSKLRIGQFAQVFVAAGQPHEALAVPASALLDDASKQIVFVQTEGERFERRVVSAGIRDQDWVGISGDVKPGERVVSKSAYEVRLASASGSIPEHGHVH